ncbi:alpha/beta fold hydrolase [Methylobacterium sp. 37f]|uniref:alpha/beta fold hydrolase n=1 Tax=Methylobacterium sp. 37f TaxID=2817058 RepID=UPI001FFDD172|nr:alpha/beta fold hydrolase [Methylobacterium sp. 37f]MCK2052919.1 alpha/beta fold hydrolase [Methylobacterium sp. 37f]
MPHRPRRRIGPLLALLPLGAAGAWIAYSRLGIDHRRRMHPALPGRQECLASAAGGLSFSAAGPAEGVPLLLIHSVNAAANAYEVRPLYRHYAKERPVYALDLPGFGFSERSDRIYTPELMTQAIHAMAAEIRRRHPGTAIDAVALSLSAEFLARAALERPDDYRSLGLISPTGFDKRYARRNPSGSDTARAVAACPLWGRALFDLLVSRPSMRFFLEKTWGSRDIDEGLLAYDQVSAHQPGAEFAPFSFLAGHLFATETGQVYPRLDRPVWMVHGTRGDFVDYRHADRFRDDPRWTVEVLETGAFPHFERLNAVTARYDAFLARLGH